jgi:hypothetical protein
MSTNKTVLLGFEVGTGHAVEIPLRHMVVSGQTQEAGKTTTLEALISRAALPAIAFITKRGEGSFRAARQLQPYFRERADWQFVSAVLEAALRERMKFERSWIMKASHGARTLADVQKNVRELQKTAKGLNADMYLTLDNYLEIVVPRLSAIKWAKSIDVQPGINVMDIADHDRFPLELQGLVMRSALEWVYEKCDGTVTIIPEAWEHLPQGRGSPVKGACELLIRKGAALQNLVWFDSQDIGGVDKAMLRHCPVWLLGVQREANEIERTLSNIPNSVKKPKKADIALLQKGQFFACFGEHVFKVYVQPAWMDASKAIAIARGTDVISDAPVDSPPPPVNHVLDVQQARAEGFRRGVTHLAEQLREASTAAVACGEQMLTHLREIDAILNGVTPATAPRTRNVNREIAEAYDTIRGGQAPEEAIAQRFQPPEEDGLSSGAARLLHAIARYPKGISWRNACVVAGMAYGNGFMYRAKRELLDFGGVTGSEDIVHITEAGAKHPAAKARSPSEDGPAPLEEIIRRWAAKINEQPSPEMLQLLAKDPTRVWSTQEFADALGRKPGNGFWYRGLKRLREAGLMDTDQIALSFFLRITAQV